MKMDMEADADDADSSLGIHYDYLFQFQQCLMVKMWDSLDEKKWSSESDHVSRERNRRKFSLSKIEFALWEKLITNFR